MIKENINTKIADNYDVVVCGGGFGGISAALAAARLGKRTLLLEHQFILGGLGTAGLITIYLPLCDGFGNQVSFGIAEELLKLSISMGCEDRYPENWIEGKGSKGEDDPRYMVQFNPHIFAILAEQLLLKEGVEILYGTYVTSVEMKDGKITHIIAENKSGRQAFGVKSVVDATGDCDIAHFANAPTETFKQGNILAGWYYRLDSDGYALNPVGACDTPEEEKKDGNFPIPIVNRRFSGLDGKEISEFVCLSHKATLDDVLKKRKDDESTVPVTIPTIPQLRMTRHIKGEYELSNTEEHKYFEDSIGMVSNWKKRGPVYEVPFRTLYSASVKNLVTAGRCTSVNETLWDVMRVIPCCAVTGQAAGTAAALFDDFTTADVSLLQKTLVDNGVVLHEKE